MRGFPAAGPWALTALAVLAAPVPPATAGRAAATVWKGGARAAVSVTMDDGYASQWRVMPGLLESRGFRGTFFIVTDWVDREDLWSRWEGVAAAGHEIGSHGKTHVALTGVAPERAAEEMEASRRRIQERLGPSQGRVLAYPDSAVSGALAEAAARAGYEAARAGGIAYNPPTPVDPFRVLSLHPQASTPLWEMNSWVDDIRKKGGWLVVGIHGIADPSRPSSPTQEGWDPVPIERYVGWVDHLAAAGDLWVAPFGEVARYVRARDAARIQVLGVADDAIRLRVEGPPGGTALTFEAEVPAEWAEIRVRSGAGSIVTRAAVERGAAPVARFEVVPPADVELTPGAKRVREAGR